MQPQNNTPQNNQQFQSPAPVTGPATASKKSKLVPLLVAVIVLVLVAAGAGTYFSTSALKTKDSELKTVQASLESTESELAAAKIKIESLDSPQKKANDVKRKNDLARFVATLNEYAANNNGTYPSTEPTSFANEFVAIYITGKLSDFVDPNTKQPYEFTPIAKIQTPPGVTLGNIQYQWPGKCAGSEFADADSDRQAAARLILESGEIYCLDS